ncbi:MAG: DUF4365 domain-containing protein, partial [Weeksellaceae bacterium]
RSFHGIRINRKICNYHNEYRSTFLNLRHLKYLQITFQIIGLSVTERDYGIDCYVELVNEKNQLTGDLASIQLKSKDTIDWNLDNTLTISNIKISTSNYWYRFPVPVFLCVTDNQKKEMYFVSVKNFIKKEFFNFCKAKNLQLFHIKRYGLF